MTSIAQSIPGAALEVRPADRPGVVLVAHGSARSGASSEPVLSLVRQLVAQGFPEVRAAFWREEPFLHQALDATRSPRLVVLPIFLAEGYFGREVVPRELGVPYGESVHDGRSVRLLRPLGTDPTLDRLVLDRGREALGDQDRADDALLVVLGHGTPRDPGSQNTVLAACARLGERGAFGRVVPAFIDVAPRVDEVVAHAPERTAVVVPFLIASGYHGGTTVPHDLEKVRRSGGQASRQIRYADPVGTHPALIGLIEKVVLGASRDFGEERGGTTKAAPLAALEPVLADRVARLGAVTFLEVEIRADGSDVFWLRHAADRGTVEAELSELSDRDALAVHTRRTAVDEHRPLRTAADLPRGWRYRACGSRALVEALVAIYGPAVVHWYLGEQGALPAGGFAEVAARQTGIYADLEQVGASGVTAGIQACCEGRPCLRTRLWDVEGQSERDARAQTSAREQESALAVPCPTPCPILLGTVLDLASS